jgi:hypothetical protein
MKYRRGLIAGKHAHGVQMPRRNTRLTFIAATLLLVGTGAIGHGVVSAAPADERDEALASIPYHRLTADATATIHEVVDRPTIYRRLPTQTISCDPKMFIFLVRNPEVLVGLWDLMEVSSVQTQRVGPYQLAADDSAGTQCTIDLVYGDSKTHIYVGKGVYTGALAPRPITGSGVFIVRSEYSEIGGVPRVVSSLDCFIQLDNLGADLLARTLSGLIGKTADHNFTETAKFISQVSVASERNPTAMRDLALDLPQVTPATRDSFIDTIVDVARRSGNFLGSADQTHPPFISRAKSDASLR